MVKWLSKLSSTACTKEAHRLSRNRAETNNPAVLDEWFGKVQQLFKTSNLKRFDKKIKTEGVEL